MTTFGGKANSTPVAADSEVVRRLRAAGAVIVGKTSMPEFGAWPYTEPISLGPTRNPWDPAHTPGGSSGGTAAAVASGMIPVGIGGDGGGSIRIPSSFCGLFGLKPQRGRVSTSPNPHLWWSLGTIGPLTRTVLDSALVYDVIRGSQDTDLYRARRDGELRRGRRPRARPAADRLDGQGDQPGRASAPAARRGGAGHRPPADRARPRRPRARRPAARTRRPRSCRSSSPASAPRPTPSSTTSGSSRRSGRPTGSAPGCGPASSTGRCGRPRR